MFKIGEVAFFTGLTIRTLRYYDEIKLVKPIRCKNGHRSYTLQNLIVLNEVTLLKSVGLSLGEIMLIINNDNSQKPAISLLRQKKLLQSQLKIISAQINKIDKLSFLYDDGIKKEVELMKNLFSYKNPLKVETEKIWSKSFIMKNKYIPLEQNLSLEFDDFFESISKFQDKKINNSKVQHEVGKFISYLMNLYNYKIDKNGLIIIANSYKYNKIAIEYLLKYGDTFNVFLSEALVYNIEKNVDNYISSD